MVEIRALSKLSEVLAIIPAKHEDDRGYFFESFRDEWFSSQGINVQFCQDNQSFSQKKGTVRGLHFQRGPHAQGKLVRCLSGSIWDVAVDIRPKSKTFGVWDALELSGVAGEQLYIPPGFAHGFITLEDSVTVAYKCTSYYNRQAEGAIRFDDPDLSIPWPNAELRINLSKKDEKANSFAHLIQNLRSTN